MFCLVWFLVNCILFSLFFPPITTKTSFIDLIIAFYYFNSEFAKILISKLDFRELDYKLQRAKVGQHIHSIKFLETYTIFLNTVFFYSEEI